MRLPDESDDHTLLDRFRADPDGRRLGDAERAHRAVLRDDRRVRLRRLPRPSGVARTRASGSAAQRAERFPLHLIANQPSSRLHGQLDAGGHSRASKVAGREPIRIHPDDAHSARHRRRRRRARVQRSRRVPRGRDRHRPTCARRSSTSRPARGSTRSIRTSPMSMCAHGNPNVLTDRSRLVTPRAGIDRPARARRDRAVRRRAAAGARPHATTLRRPSLALGNPAGHRDRVRAGPSAQDRVVRQRDAVAHPSRIEHQDVVAVITIVGERGDLESTERHCGAPFRPHRGRVVDWIAGPGELRDRASNAADPFASRAASSSRK